MFKVLITGAYSTGKTTLAASLCKELEGLGLSVARVPDVGRDCPVPLNADQTEDATLWLLTSQIAREIQVSLGPERIMVCDRGVPDVLAHHRDRLTSDDVLVGLLEPFLSHWQRTYDLILFSRVDERIAIVGDGLRNADATYRSQLDRHAELVLAGVAGVRTLPFGDLERLAYARAVIMRSIVSEPRS